MKFGNYMILDFPSKSANEAFARSAVACFAAQLDPTLEELGDIRTAVSEAVTNCIVHAYKYEQDEKKKKIYIQGKYDTDGFLTVTVKDSGCGIDDVKLAMQPLFTTDAANERSGMGFSIMESFTDKLTVRSQKGKGTGVTMVKRLNFKKRLSDS